MGPTDEIDRLGQRAWAVLETVHVPVFFAPEPVEEYETLGLGARAGYFYSRGAALGAVPAAVVAATFYVFNPALVAHLMADGWTHVDPGQLVRARRRGIGRFLDRALSDVDETALGEAVELVRELTEGCTAAGRPLYAAHAALDWPTEARTALWHGAGLLREFRGDAHMSALLHHDLDPVQALLVDAVVTGRHEFLTRTRGWSAEQFATAETGLRARGLLAGPAFTGPDTTILSDAGRALHDAVQERTRAACTAAWTAFGPERTVRLTGLVTPLAAAITDTGVFPAWLRRR